MNKYQIRILKDNLYRDAHCTTWGIKHPILRKEIKDIKFIQKRSSLHVYTITVEKNVYKTYNFDTPCLSSTVYVITLNDRIIYWEKSPVYAPACKAMHILTEVFHGYKPKTSEWLWQSVHDCFCIDESMSNWFRDPGFNPACCSKERIDSLRKYGNWIIPVKKISQEEANLLFLKA